MKEPFAVGMAPQSRSPPAEKTRRKAALHGSVQGAGRQCLPTASAATPAQVSTAPNARHPRQRTQAQIQAMLLINHSAPQAIRYANTEPSCKPSQK
jgi:hypothetical protein